MAALASVESLATRLGRELSEADQARAQAVLDDVSVEVAQLGDPAWLDDGADVPAVVAVVVLSVALRRFEVPVGVESVTTDTFTERYDVDGRGLLPSEVRNVRRAAGLPGVSTVPLEGAWPPVANGTVVP